MSEVAASIWSHLGLVITALCSKLHVSVGFCKPKPKMRRNLPILHYLGDGTLVGWEASLADPLALADAQPAEPLPLAGRLIPLAGLAGRQVPSICSLIGVPNVTSVGPKVTSVVSLQSYLPVPKGPATTYKPGDFFASLLEAEKKKEKEKKKKKGPPPPPAKPPPLRDPRASYPYPEPRLRTFVYSCP